MITFTACGRAGPVTVTESAPRCIAQPASSSLRSAASKWSGTTPSSRILPPVMAAAAAKVAASMRSGMIVVSIGRSAFTPWIVSRREPSPSMRAPHATSTSPSTVTSGSNATFSSTVVPCASTAAIMSCAVAPTETTSKLKFAPLSFTSRPTI